jgi:hypothetical protein
VKTKLIRRLKRKTCPELVSGDGSAKTKELKLTAINTVFLDLRTSIEDCERVIKAFKKLDYTTYYDAKTKTIKTTAPKTRIKELSKLFKCIQSYSLIQKQ